MTYEIILGAEIISRDPPQYRAMADNGFLLPCTEAEAQAVIVGDTVYAIDPDVPVPGYPDAETIVIRVKPNGGHADALFDTTGAHTAQITDLEASAADQTIETATRLDDIEAVLGEMLVGGM